MFLFSSNQQEAFDINQIDDDELEEISDYKSQCEKDYLAKSGMSNDAIECCKLIFVNYCFEKKYGLRKMLFLERITDSKCEEQLKDPKDKCDIDTR